MERQGDEGETGERFCDGEPRLEDLKVDEFNLGVFAHPLKKVQSRGGLPGGSQGMIMLHEISKGIAGERPL